MDWVVRLAGDLVDLVDVDDAGLRAGHIAGRLDQAEQDVLDILTDVAGFGQRGGVGDRERNIEQPGQGLGQQRFAAAGRADEQDVALLELDLIIAVVIELGVDALVVVVDRHGEDPLGAVLADDILVQLLVETLRGRNPGGAGPGRGERLAPLLR